MVGCGRIYMTLMHRIIVRDVFMWQSESSVVCFSGMARKESSLNPDQKLQKIMYVTVVWKRTKEHHFSITASLTTSHPHNLPPSQLLILTTSHPHNLPPSQPPILTTSHPHNFPPSQPPPTLTTSHPPLMQWEAHPARVHQLHVQLPLFLGWSIHHHPRAPPVHGRIQLQNSKKNWHFSQG